ncbi:MAG: hypothetical protein AB7G06_03265 [Bdellovibrionales bacterium]
MSFITYIPGLQDPTQVDGVSQSIKSQFLKDSGFSGTNIHYQTAANPAPQTMTEMADKVAKRLIEQQQRTGYPGIVVASSVGAAVMMRAAQMITEQGYALPHVVMINPVADPVETIRNAVGENVFEALRTGHKLQKIDMPVAGGGTYPITTALLKDMLAYRDRPTGTFPSLQVLTGAVDPLCNDDEAQRITATLLAERKFFPVIWQGGHTENNAERHGDLLKAIHQAADIGSSKGAWNAVINFTDRIFGATGLHKAKRTRINTLRDQLHALKPEEQVRYKAIKHEMATLRATRVTPRRKTLRAHQYGA